MKKRKISPGVESCKSIFFGVDGVGYPTSPKVYQVAKSGDPVIHGQPGQVGKARSEIGRWGSKAKISP